MKKLIVLILVVGLLLWAVPVTALAEDASGTIGETSAEVNTQTETTNASASAAFSDTTGQSIGSVETHADVNQGSDSNNDGGGTETIQNGAGLTTTLEEWSTNAEAHYGNGSGSAEGTEEVYSVEITAPNGFPVKILLKADYSSGQSLAEIDTTGGDVSEENVSYADSYHSIGGEPATVYLYDNVIVFDSAEANAEAWIDGDGNADSGARAYISNLRVWDSIDSSYTTAGYPVPLNVDSMLLNQAEIDALRTALNAVLAKSNVRITALVWTYTTTNTKLPYAHAHAIAMIAEFLDVNGNPVASITICDDAASATPIHALAQDVEAKFSSMLEQEPKEEPKEEPKPEPKEEPKPEPKEEPKITPSVTSQGTTSGTTTGQGELPVTGANLALFGLVVALLLGTGITLRRRYAYEPKH